MSDDRIRAEVERHTLPGRDRDLALAMLSQARRGDIKLDDIQVTHLLAIGYDAGRAVGYRIGLADRPPSLLERLRRLRGRRAARR